MKVLSKRRGLYILVPLVCILMFGLTLRFRERSSKGGTVTMLTRPYALPTQRVNLLDRIMPRGNSWAWLWKLRYTWFGRGKSIKIRATIFKLTEPDMSRVVSLGKAEIAGSDGMEVWKIMEGQRTSLQELFKDRPEKVLAAPGIVTGNKTAARMFSGSPVSINGTQQQVGVSVDFLPVIRGQQIELTAIVSFSEVVSNSMAGGSISLRTNFEFASRFRLAKASPGVFVLCAPLGSEDQKRLGLLLTCELVGAKK